MATPTEGAYPYDPTTEVGMFRFQVGDTVSTPQVPETNPLIQDYEFIGDATITALLAAYPDSPLMAKSIALDSMATQLIAAAQDIQVDDIRIKSVERANLMLKRATEYALAAASGEADASFDVVPLTLAGPYCPPQGTPWSLIG